MVNLYNPTTQQLTEVAGMDTRDSLIKVQQLPTATSSYLNKIYLLVDEQLGYVKGGIYQCQVINGTYKWIAISQQTPVDVVEDDNPNAVSSNAVYESEKEMWKVNGVLGAKNLIPYPYTNTTKTINGITFTDNGDGTVTANGTASDTAYFYIQLPLTLPKGQYIVSDKGENHNSNAHIQLYLYESPYTTIATTINDNRMFTLTGETNITVRINVLSGTTLSNTVFYPMIRLASDPDDTYVPYAMTNKELTDNKVGWDSNTLVGVKNLNGTIYKTKTQNGITFTANSDGTVTVNGTPTGAAQDGNDTGSEFIAPFTAQVIVSGGVNVNAHVYPWDNTTNSRPYSSYLKTELVTGDAYGDVELSFYMEKGHSYRIMIRINASSGTLSDAVFKPLLRLATDPDDTYVSYAKTNRELTDFVDGKVYSFTPSLKNCTATYTTCAGRYVKHGNMVYCAIAMRGTITSATGLAIADVSNVPEIYRTQVIGEQFTMSTARMFSCVSNCVAVYCLPTTGEIYLRSSGTSTASWQTGSLYLDLECIWILNN